MKKNKQAKRPIENSPPQESRNNQPSDAAHEPAFYKTNDFVGVMHFVGASLLRSELEWSGFTFDDAVGLTCWELRVGLGLALLAAGAWILKLSYGELERFSQPYEPGKPTTKLVTTGPFSWSRNPAYMANLLCIAPGFAVLCNDLWILVFVPVTAIVFYFLLIAPEEKYLKARFGQEWDDYCKVTRRWL